MVQTYYFRKEGGGSPTWPKKKVLPLFLDFDPATPLHSSQHDFRCGSHVFMIQMVDSACMSQHKNVDACPPDKFLTRHHCDWPRNKPTR